MPGLFVLSRSQPLFVSILVSAVVLAGLAAVTGVWRLGLRPFGLDARNMTPRRLGFHVEDSADEERVNGVCRAFAGGFNQMIARPSARAWTRFAAEQPAFYRPFVHEGAAMGYPLRSLWRFSPERFEREIVTKDRRYTYLYYVGLGFWHGKRNTPVEKLERLVGKLDPLHGMLCWDGYGFKHGFFDFRDGSAWADRFDRVGGYGRNVVFQGIGRSLWFRYLATPDRLVGAVDSCGRYAKDAASGVALASVFASFDRLDRGSEILGRLSRWNDDVLLGMCFAFKARSISDKELFDSVVDGLDEAKQAAIGSAIERCDAIEAQIRAEGGPDGYRRWRTLLKDWLGEYIEYPFAAPGPSSTGAAAIPGIEASV